jgi:TolB protein
MARQKLEDNAAYIDAVIPGSGLTELQFRDTNGDVTHAVNFPVTGPVRFELERKANWFIMYAANAGQPLQELGSYSLKLSNPIYLGLAVCSHNSNDVETAVFSDVSFQETPAHRKGKAEE